MKKFIVSIAICIGILSAFGFATMQNKELNITNPDDNYIFQVLETHGLTFEKSDENSKVTKKEAIDNAYEKYAAVISLPPEQKLKAKAYRAIKKVENSSEGKDVWVIVFEGGKYKEKLYPNANYAMAVLVDSQTGEPLEASGFDLNDEKLKSEIKNKNK